VRVAALLALIPLIGAAPVQSGGPAGAAVECKLDYAAAEKAVAALAITRSSGEDPAGEGGFIQYFNPAGISVMGQPATIYTRGESISEGTHRTIFRADIPGTYPEARAAMLTLHGKSSCDAHESTEPGKLGCMVHIRNEGTAPNRDVDMILLEHEGVVTLGCIFGNKQ
jgi:hypothetical protein